MQLPSAERYTAGLIVGTLEEMLSKLAAATGNGDVDWLRPLAVLSVEIEYSALRCTTVDQLNLVDECRELSTLLTGGASESEFARRYPAVRRSCPAVAELHARILSACCHVAKRCDLALPVV